MFRPTRLWEFLSDLGVRYVPEEARKKSVRMQNRISLVAVLVTWIQAISFFHVGLTYPAIISFAAGLLYITSITISAFGGFCFARILFLLIVLGAVGHHHFYFGFTSGFWLLWLAAPQAVFVLFPALSLRNHLVFSVLLTGVISAAIVSSMDMPPIFSEMTSALTHQFMRGNAIRSPIVFILIAFYLVYENRRSEKVLSFAAAKEKELADAKSFLLSNVSHELRTPVNAIKGFADILIENSNSIADTKQRERFQSHLNQIAVSAASLTAIIGDILDFARIEQKRITLHKRDFDLVALCEEALRTAEFHGRHNGAIETELFFAPDFPRKVYGDDTRVTQILVNLLSNAMKFTHQGKVTLRALLMEQDDARLHISFEIEDTGIGIPGEKLPYLFESFSPISRETAVRYGGTGLGLAITKQLVEILNGKISVMSTPGRGSLFMVDFWLEKAKEEVALPSKVMRDLKRARILVAEDNEVNQLLVRTLLESWNGEIEIVENGLKAIGAVQRGSYDLILMDLQMPFMDGFEACENIRLFSDKEKAMIPIVALTADVLNETRKKVFTVGMNDIITKPINQADLYAVLRKHLNQVDVVL